ncbi:MAG TPA: hypothetical protein VFG84_03070 [Gemmatimonadaceae bacterium]|nr:hypothetical protein [Gemmatimonadaceae bacterium]
MSTSPRAMAEAILRHLAPACDAMEAEVIVVRVAEPGWIKLPVIDELGWQLLEVPAGCTPAQMRAEGMAAARGDVVAFRTDTDAGDGVWLDAYAPVVGAEPTALDVERPVRRSDERGVPESRGRRPATEREVSIVRRSRDVPLARDGTVAHEL